MTRIVVGLALVAVVVLGGQRGAAQDGAAPDAARYLGQMVVLSEMIGDSMDRNVALTASPRFFDEDWRFDFVSETAIWRAVYGAATGIEPPDHLRPMHDATLAAFAAYDEAATHARYGVEFYDEASIAAAADWLRLGNERLAEATEIAESVG